MEEYIYLKGSHGSKLTRGKYVYGLGWMYPTIESKNGKKRQVERLNMSIDEVRKSFQPMRDLIKNSLSRDFKSFLDSDKAQYQIDRFDGSSMPFDIKSYGDHFVDFEIVVETNILTDIKFTYLYKYVLKVGEGTPFGRKYTGPLERLCDCLKGDVTSDFLKTYNSLTSFGVQRQMNTDRFRLSIIEELKADKDFLSLQRNAPVISLIDNRIDLTRVAISNVMKAQTLFEFTGGVDELYENALRGKNVVESMNALGPRRFDYVTNNRPVAKVSAAIVKAATQGVLYSGKIVSPGGYCIPSLINDVTSLGGSDLFTTSSELVSEQVPFVKKKHVDIFGKALPAGDLVVNGISLVGLIGSFALPESVATCCAVFTGVGAFSAAAFSLLESFSVAKRKQVIPGEYLQSKNAIMTGAPVPSLVKDFIFGGEPANEKKWEKFKGFEVTKSYVQEGSESLYSNRAMNSYSQVHDSYYREMDKMQREADHSNVLKRFAYAMRDLVDRLT